jgi:hypothetical protein
MYSGSNLIVSEQPSACVFWELVLVQLLYVFFFFFRMTLRDFPKHSQRSSLTLAFAFTVTYTFLWVKIAGAVLGTVEVSWAVGPSAVWCSASCLWLAAAS